MSKTDPHEQYPKPIGVLTATLLGYKEENPFEIILVELQKPADANRELVLPGGIFELGRGKHRSQREVIEMETIEETGLSFAPGYQPEHFAISQRLDVDPRRWCSFPTINGASDYVMACPLVGTIAPRDTDEVRQALFRDVRTLDRTRIGRGHDLLVALWQEICLLGGLKRVMQDEELRKSLESLSTEKHVVSVSELTGMIYLEDRIAVNDTRE